MGKVRSWTDEDLAKAAEVSLSMRSVIQRLGLVPAGGNYAQVSKRIIDLRIDTTHFTGKGWRTGERVSPVVSPIPLDQLLVNPSTVQSYKLKKKLFAAGIKTAQCELCGWAEVSADGRVPLELDHINGNHNDNRLQNLRILCPNCHSLQPTHRGKNKKVRLARVVERYTRDT